MRRTTLVSLLLTLALAANTVCQPTPCFGANIPDVKLLKGDIHAVDLDNSLIQSKPELKVQLDVEGAQGIINLLKTFNGYSPSYFALNEEKYGKINICTSYSHGSSDGDWVFLCDNNKIVFISVNETTGEFDSQRTTVINLAPSPADAGMSCDSIRNGGTQNLYAVCQKPGSDSIFMFTLDLVSPVRQDPDEIKQPNAEFKLVGPFKLSVNEYLTDAGAQISIFIHEREPKTDQLHFRMFKYSKGRLIDGGYFSTSITGSIKNGKNAQLQSVFVNDEYVFLQTKSGQKNYLQRCLRNPIYSIFVCDEHVTELAEGNFRIKLFYVDKTKRTTRMVWIYYVSDTLIKNDMFDPDTNTYMPGSGSFEFTGHSLIKVVDFQRAGNNIYLIGPTKSDRFNFADGLVKFKTISSTWEEYSYGPDASLGLVMQDLHETHFANYLSIGSNMINFNRIKKNILMLNTVNLDDKYTNLRVTIECTGINNSKSTMTFRAYTQLSVNSEDSLRVAVPSVEAYVGSAYIYIPTNGDDVSGNAPVLKSIDAGTLTNITTEYLMINPQKIQYSTPEVRDITDLKHVGENWFAIQNNDQLSFFICLKNGAKGIKCTDSNIQVDLKTDNLQHIHTEISEGIAVILLSQRPPEDETARQKATPKTIIQAIRLEDGGKEFEDKTYPFYTKIGNVKVIDQIATIILGGSIQFTGSIDMHFLKFDLAAKNFPTQVSTLTSFSNHICPTQISWAPRSSSTLYVSSVCDDSGLNNHVFQYQISFEMPYLSQITEVYVVEGSREFSICAQDRLLNIIDMERDVFYSFDSQSSNDAKLYFPTSEYGIKELKNYACDQDNNILQIIGCNDETYKNCSLMTYNANSVNSPNKRVHSVQEIDPTAQFIASSFNDENDDTLTLLFGKDTNTVIAYSVEVDGPHLLLKAATQETAGGVFKITESFSFMGKDGVLNDDNQKLIQSEHNLTLVPQAVDITMQLTKPDFKLLMDNTPQPLEDYVVIGGPFHSVIPPQVEGVTFVDRMSVFGHYKGLEPTFDDAMYHKEFVFGYKKQDERSKLGVYVVGKTLFEVTDLDKVSDLQFVAKNDNEFYFFALVKKIYKKDRIYTIYTKTGGKTWLVAQASLDTEGYKIMEVNNAPGNFFFFGGYNNLRGYKSVVFTFSVEETNIIITTPNTYNLEDNIVDFDITFIEGTNNLIVVAGMEYSQQAEFFWYQVTESGYLKLVGQQKAALVPGMQEAHEDIVFRCEQRNNDTKFLWCVNSGKNLYSYFVKYQLDFTEPKAGLSNNFITKSLIHTKLRNIVNLKPMKVDLLGDYISFMVKNIDPVKTGAARHPGAFFSDSYISLTYKISSNAEAVEVGEIPVRDVFKILTMGDLEILDLKLLENLDPRYFVGPDGLPKFGINLGTTGKSIKVFSLNGLSITLDGSIEAHREFVLSFNTINDGIKSSFPAKDYFEIKNKPDPTPESDCFQGTVPDVKLLKGDIHAVDLDPYVIDNQVEFTINTDIENANSWINTIKTFDWSPSDLVIDASKFGKINTCTAYSAGLSDGDWAFLCDLNKVVFVSVNTTNGRFDDLRTTVVSLVQGVDDAEMTCDSIRNGGTQNLYAVCSIPENSNIYIYSIDLATPVRTAPFVILQGEPESRMKAPYKLSVDLYSTDKGAQVVLFIHEREPSSPELRFQTIKNVNGKLINTGYFGTDKGNILNGQKGQLQSIFMNDEFIILQTRVGLKNYLQRCLRNPLYSKIKCFEKVTTLAEGNFKIKLFYVDSTKRISHMVRIYYVSTDTVKYDLYDPDTDFYTPDINSISLVGHSLRRVVDFQRAGNNFFLVGPTEDINIANGLVKLKTKTNTWEEYSYGPDASLGLVMQDLHETHYANYLAVGSNKIMFRRIKKNVLVIYTDLAEQQTSSVLFTIKCNGQIKNTSSSLSFRANTLVNVNQESSIKLDVGNVEALLGSSVIYMPSNGDDISGNAPMLDSINIADVKNIIPDYRMINAEKFTFDDLSMEGITGLTYVGGNYFTIQNGDSLKFFVCSNPDDQQFICTQTGKNFELKINNYAHIHTKVVDQTALIVFSTIPPNDSTQRAKAIPKTLIKAVRLGDSQDEFQAKTYDFYSKFGQIRANDELVTIVFAGANSYDGKIDMHYINFNMTDGHFSESIGSLTSFQNHICPAQISWCPRDADVLYVSSICDNNGLDNHVFKYKIDFKKPFQSEITEVYVVRGSREFNICAQERFLNIIDMERDVFYSFDTRSSIETQLYFPTNIYGIKDLKTYACDQDNNILQIMGCTDDKRTSCYLLTYRANLAHIPNKRVHSITKIDPSVEFIASSFNDKNDDTITFMVGKSSKTKFLYSLEVDGPHLRLKAETENSEGTFMIKEIFSFMGKDGVLNDANRIIKTAEQNLTLVAQSTEVKMVLTDPTKKMKMDGTLQYLENFVTITGPYHSVVTDAASKVQINDRMAPSMQFDSVKQTWIDSLFHKDYIFGYSETKTRQTLSVYQNNLGRIIVSDLDKVSDLQFVAKNDNEFYFFALVKKIYKKDRIYTIYTKTGGKTWLVAQASLDTEGYKMMKIKGAGDNKFVFGGYNNLKGYKVNVLGFTVDGKDIIASAPNSHISTDNIVDFDITFIEGTNNLIVVAGMEYSKQATFLWYQMESSGYLKHLGLQQMGLVPGLSETHEGIVFKCEQRSNVPKSLWCINSGKNMYSYFVKYQLDFTEPKAGLSNNFITDATVETKLRNIVNLRPIAVDLNEEYVTFMVKNLLPIQPELTGSKLPGAFFEDSHLCLTYNLTGKTAPTKDNEVPVRDVFKILTKEDLEVSNPKSLSNLMPRYFIGVDKQVKLGVNVGTDQKSVKVFNLSPLSIILDGNNEAHRTYSIKLKKINNKETTDFKASEFFEVKNSTEPKKQEGLKKQDNLWYIIVIVSIIVVVIGLGIIGYIANQKPGQSELEEPVIDDVEKTMKLPDDSRTVEDDSKL